MVTKDGIRSKVLSTYTGNTLIGALESSYSLTDLPNCETLRKACCYAFADYLFDLAGDPNGTDPVEMPVCLTIVRTEVLYRTCHPCASHAL